MRTMISQFIGQTEAAILRFSVSLLTEIELKIIKKQIISQHQAMKYAKKQIDLFVKQMHFRQALIAVYRSELYIYISKKLAHVFEKYCVFKCV
ncbi:hypothetical protein MX569_13615 [Anoxybacillus kestanbolensis]|uniref:hypothetical protein n=1 Tax=Anoxybacillus TaxID=150247 RepID=UPI001EDA6C83|nr:MULTISPECIES: hypothetical protein [unclassified Anoxybacillus]MCG3085084.1 hypothetical protein [Anoxybacillus sp. LAT27]MCL9971588.1 hypothetical protein [Anoxybacillus kestanbolensis]